MSTMRGVGERVGFGLILWLVVAAPSIVAARSVPAEETPPESEPEAPEAGESGDPEPPGESAKPKEPEKEQDPLQGSFVLAPRGMLVVVAGWGTRRLVPGQYGLYVAPPVLDGDQWTISPSNSTLGFLVSGVTWHGWALKGALDVTLKSPTPQSRTVLAPLFYDVYIALEKPDAYVLAGQFPDVILPFVPRSVNGFPGSYIPGMLGFYRPQVRGGRRFHLSEAATLAVEGALARDVQNYEVSPLVVGGNAGIPDVQVDVSFGAGPESGPERPRWERAFGVSVGGFFGRRAFGRESDEGGAFTATAEVDAWAVTAAVRAVLPTGTTIRAQVWTGQTLSDYAAGAFQSINGTLDPIRATGFWSDLEQRLTRRWSLGAGFGRDDPEDARLDDGQRALNESAFVNLYWLWSRRVTFAGQVSWWLTDWKGLGVRESWRFALLTAVRW